jgi:hypothetical protein
MPLIVPTPARRRVVMGVLIALAVAGGVIRATAPEPSTLRDVGTLLLVLWLPAVGNLVAWAIRQFPRKAPRVIAFTAGSAFTEHLRVQADVRPLAGDVLAAFDATDPRCTLIVGRQGFTARFNQPAVQILSSPGPQLLPLELLRPEAAVSHLLPGTTFHLLVGQTPAALGRVDAVPSPVSASG